MKRLLVLAVVAAFAQAGCAGGPKRSTTLTDASPTATTRSSEVVRIDPILLRALRAPASSPKIAVLKLWALGQVGAGPSVAAVYDPAVRREVGAATLAAAAIYQRPTYLEATPKLVSISPSRMGALVVISVSGHFESFLLRRRSAIWTILFDTVMDRALWGYATSQA